MRKETPPPFNRHLQLVRDDAAPAAPSVPEDWASPPAAAPLLQQIAADGQRRFLGGWQMGLVGLVVVVMVYASLHLGAAHLRHTASKSFDARRFSMAVRVRSRLAPQAAEVVSANDTIHPDDAFSFVLHNRSHQNAYFGLFAAGQQGQFFWFYPRDGGGVDLQTLPLPAIPTITLPDGVVPDSLPPGPFVVMAVFLPQSAALSELEQDFAQGGANRLRERHKADVQALPLTLTGP